MLMWRAYKIYDWGEYRFDAVENIEKWKDEECAEKEQIEDFMKLKIERLNDRIMRMIRWNCRGDFYSIFFLEKVEISFSIYWKSIVSGFF